MARVLRTALPDGYFHAYARGLAGLPIFPDPRDRTIFLHLMRKAAHKHDWEVFAACAMSTHYHIVLESARAALSRGMQWLNSNYARAFNKRYGRFGSVFAERFQARRIEQEETIYETCAYVLLNPVKAGVCDRVEDWPWSYSSYGLDVT
jgi:REP element-mobilizing transposase RayT